jgi:hypothetical protein
MHHSGRKNRATAVLSGPRGLESSGVDRRNQERAFFKASSLIAAVITITARVATTLKVMRSSVMHIYLVSLVDSILQHSSAQNDVGAGVSWPKAQATTV